MKRRITKEIGIRQESIEVPEVLPLPLFDEVFIDTFETLDWVILLEKPRSLKYFTIFCYDCDVVEYD